MLTKFGWGRGARSKVLTDCSCPVWGGVGRESGIPFCWCKAGSPHSSRGKVALSGELSATIDCRLGVRDTGDPILDNKSSIICAASWFPAGKHSNGVCGVAG